MKKLTTSERFERIYNHQDADRMPIIDSPWRTTVERWHREGMPEGMDFSEYFDIDRIADIGIDNSPQFETRTVEETDEYRVYTTVWGATLKEFKHMDTTPEFIDFTITTPEAWKKAKERMVPTPERIPWNRIQANYKKWREEGFLIRGDFWFGFDVTHSWTVGTETLLIALLEEPEWCMDMFNHFLDMDIALFEMILDKGYTLDHITWPDDMGYKHNQFFSVKTYREILKPVHKRAVEWAHSKGIKAHMHSCGDVNPFVPELIEIGLDALNPLEVKAGMNPTELKQKFGDKIVLHGGMDALLWNDLTAMQQEMERIIPVVKQNGGYVFSTDHSVPNNVSLEDFRTITELAKKLGSY